MQSTQDRMREIYIQKAMEGAIGGARCPDGRRKVCVTKTERKRLVKKRGGCALCGQQLHEGQMLDIPMSDAPYGVTAGGKVRKCPLKSQTHCPTKRQKYCATETQIKKLEKMRKKKKKGGMMYDEMADGGYVLGPDYLAHSDGGMAIGGFPKDSEGMWAKKKKHYYMIDKCGNFIKPQVPLTGYYHEGNMPKKRECTVPKKKRECTVPKKESENRWVNFLRDYAEKNNVSYAYAVSSKDACRQYANLYRNGIPTKSCRSKWGKEFDTEFFVPAPTQEQPSPIPTQEQSYPVPFNQVGISPVPHVFPANPFGFSPSQIQDNFPVGRGGRKYRR